MRELDVRLGTLSRYSRPALGQAGAERLRRTRNCPRPPGIDRRRSLASGTPLVQTQLARNSGSAEGPYSKARAFEWMASNGRMGHRHVRGVAFETYSQSVLSSSRRRLAAVSRDRGPRSIWAAFEEIRREGSSTEYLPELDIALVSCGVRRQSLPLECLARPRAGHPSGDNHRQQTTGQRAPDIELPPDCRSPRATARPALAVRSRQSRRASRGAVLDYPFAFHARHESEARTDVRANLSRKTPLRRAGVGAHLSTRLITDR